MADRPLHDEPCRCHGVRQGTPIPVSHGCPHFHDTGDGERACNSGGAGGGPQRQLHTPRDGRNLAPRDRDAGAQRNQQARPCHAGRALGALIVCILATGGSDRPDQGQRACAALAHDDTGDARSCPEHRLPSRPCRELQGPR